MYITIFLLPQSLYLMTTQTNIWWQLFKWYPNKINFDDFYYKQRIINNTAENILFNDILMLIIIKNLKFLWNVCTCGGSNRYYRKTHAERITCRNCSLKPTRKWLKIKQKYPAFMLYPIIFLIHYYYFFKSLRYHKGTQQ